MDQLAPAKYSPYRIFTAAEWARFRADAPLTLSEDEVTRLRSLGDPIDLAARGATLAQPGTLIAATDDVMGEISALLSQLRGEPAPPARWDPSQHGQKETGRLDP